MKDDVRNTMKNALMAIDAIEVEIAEAQEKVRYLRDRRLCLIEDVNQLAIREYDTFYPAVRVSHKELWKIIDNHS